jgi:hypothetical protein
MTAASPGSLFGTFLSYQERNADTLYGREEVADLIEGFFTPSSTDAHNREIIISDYDEEPEMLESDIRQT